MTALPAAQIDGVGKAPVLVADDDPDVRTMVRMLLELDGHEVIEAKDGSAALEMIHTHRPSVVVADVQMPGLTGLQLCQRIKAEELRDAPRVIVYTAGMATRDDAEKAGCDGFFLKTDPLPHLRDAVRRFVGAL